ncbi:glycoside hydrolase family 36 protein [Phytohabitans sp. LJ34]|uniref:glycoside hydrolase family 36 protein n=1 Tax=Phytohabitans sp. LJ34 TaxID=3452217 RepID=UPI003F8B7DD2
MTSLESVTSLVWGHAALTLVVDVSPDGPVALRMLSAGIAPHPPRATQPLVEVLVAGEGRAQVSQRFSETAIGRRLVYAGSAQRRDGAWRELTVELRDERTGLTAELLVRSPEGVSACQVRTRLTNHGAAPVRLLGLTSFAAGFGATPVADLDLVRADSEWLGESRWTRHPLRDAVPDLNLGLHGQDARGRVALTSQGTWSTGAHLPTGGLVDRVGGPAWLWQVEHNGPWRWEVGERRGGAYVALLGPTDIDHQWAQWLAPGESFTSVPVSVAVSADGLDGAVAALTAHRRALLRPHPDRSALPVVFNDYMNTLAGDPTTAKLLPLIDAAADAGAEVFCVDAGWYDNDANWWDSVGEWQPSQTRFPRGIEEVLARIRAHGMLPGLWLEPEVIGVRSPMADKLPPEAFLQRGGVRVVEHGRYHLDLRHPRAVAHLDEVVDRLVEQLGVGYFKLDYNIDPGAGTDLDADSAGAGLLGHNRAHLAWLDRLLDRHPDLILENCASGAMRMDYAVLSRMQLQSTSDQQDFLRYPPIAVAAPMSVLPEQSASWAYPQPDMTPEELAYTMCTGMLGRLYLSGHLDHMSPEQRASVRAAVRTHQAIRADLAAAVPLWPLGLPRWDDPWLSLALRTGNTTYLAVWRRGGATAPATLALPHLRGRDVRIDVLYPRDLPAWRLDWAAGSLTVTPTGAEPAARLIKITEG